MSRWPSGAPKGTYQGSPCKRCGHTKRYVSSRGCIACSKIKNKKKYAVDILIKNMKKGQSKTIRENGSVYVCAPTQFNDTAKLGMSVQNAAKRMQDIQIGNPNDLKMYYFSNPFPIGYVAQYEQSLKEAFKNRHIRGEWFKMSEIELMSLIDNIQEDVDILNDSEYHGDKIIKNVLKGVKYYDRILGEE